MSPAGCFGLWFSASCFYVNAVIYSFKNTTFLSFQKVWRGRGLAMVFSPTLVQSPREFDGPWF